MSQYFIVAPSCLAHAVTGVFFFFFICTGRFTRVRFDGWSSRQHAGSLLRPLAVVEKKIYLSVAVGWAWTLALLDSSPRPILSRSHTRCCSHMHQLILLVLQSERGNGSLCKYPRHELILRMEVQCLIIPFHIDNGVIFLYHVIGIFFMLVQFSSYLTHTYVIQATGTPLQDRRNIKYHPHIDWSRSNSHLVYYWWRVDRRGIKQLRCVLPQVWLCKHNKKVHIILYWLTDLM